MTYYLKSKRSIEKPQNAGPAAYVLAADEAALNRQIQLLKVLAAAAHGDSASDRSRHGSSAAAGSRTLGAQTAQRTDAQRTDDKPISPLLLVHKPSLPEATSYAWTSRSRESPMRSWIANTGRRTIRRSGPMTTPGWSFGDLFNAKAVRITDRAILSAKMEPVADPSESSANDLGSGTLYAVNNSGQIGLAALAYALKGADISIAEERFSKRWPSVRSWIHPDRKGR